MFSQLGELQAAQAPPARPARSGVMGCMAQLAEGQRSRSAPPTWTSSSARPPSPGSASWSSARGTSGGPCWRPGEGPLVKITARPDGGRSPQGVRHGDGGLREALHLLRVPTTRGRERSQRPRGRSSRRSAASSRRLPRGDAARPDRQRLRARSQPATDLAALLERVNDVDGIERIRFTTSNPYNLTPRLIRAMRDVPKVCEYFHLPLQSGSDRVLERMNRGYTRARYLELIDELQDDGAGPSRSPPISSWASRARPRTTSRRRWTMVERVGYDNVFAFRYSRRPGTPGGRRWRTRCPTRSRRSATPRLLEVTTRVAAARSAPAGRARDRAGAGGRRSRKDPREPSGRTRCNRVVNFDAGWPRPVGRVVACASSTPCRTASEASWWIRDSRRGGRLVPRLPA